MNYCPHLAGAVVERVERSADGVRIAARPRGDQGVCPACVGTSWRVHSRYERSLADVTVGGQRVVIRLRIRWLVCQQAACSTATLAEQLTGLTPWYARRTMLLRGVLEQIGLALAGRAGPAVTNFTGRDDGDGCGHDVGCRRRAGRWFAPDLERSFPVMCRFMSPLRHHPGCRSTHALGSSGFVGPRRIPIGRGCRYGSVAWVHRQRTEEAAV
jgi:hypothetical protein